MKTPQQQQLFFETFKNLTDLKKWLERSYQACQKIGIKDDYADVEYDTFENLTSRFARTTDYLINRIYRTIDLLELENPGTLIDTVNRAHKRQLIDSVDEIRLIKELRNEIAHEYTSRDLKEVFSSVFNYTPKILHLIENVNRYSEKFKNI